MVLGLMVIGEIAQAVNTIPTNPFNNKDNI